MKISKIQVTKKIAAGMHQHLQYEPEDFQLRDEEGNYLCNLSQFLNKVNSELNIIAKIKQDEKKLEPSGAV